MEKMGIIKAAYDIANERIFERNFIEALKKTEETISVHGKNISCALHHQLQGNIFFTLASETETSDAKCLYLFASVECYSTASRLNSGLVIPYFGCSRSLIQLGDELRVKSFYTKALSKAEDGLSKIELMQGTSAYKQKLEKLESTARQKIMNENHKELIVHDTNTEDNQKVLHKKEVGYNVDELKRFWVKLDEKTKRDFLVVDLANLIDFIQKKYDNTIKDQFKKCTRVFDFDFDRWRFWKCHLCLDVSYCYTGCEQHILANHSHRFISKFNKPMLVDKVLVDMISSGDWEPVHTEAAVTLIKARSNQGKLFTYVNGWCNDWPLAKDADRKNTLNQFSQLLKSSCPTKNGTLSLTLWDWLIEYTEKNLKLPGVSESYLAKCGFFKTPQCICFLDFNQLEYILEDFSRRTSATNVCTSLVSCFSTVVNRLWEKTLVKERIDFDLQTRNILLDERLLYETEHYVDEIGTVMRFSSSDIYEHVIPQGDKFISWMFDCKELDKTLVSQMAGGVYNFEIWSAASRIMRAMVRRLRSYDDKKHEMVTYGNMLSEIERLCDKEDRRSIRKRYALLLNLKCHEYVKKGNGSKCFINVVRDVLGGATSPKFETLYDTEDLSNLSVMVENDKVKESLRNLRSSLKQKILLIDSKILLNESTCKQLSGFPKLSTCDNRLVVIPFVKMFLQDKLKEMMRTDPEPRNKKLRG